MMEDDDILRAAALPLRVSCLEEAAKLTAGDRDATYGPPVENMQRTADIFNAVTGRDLTATDVALMMVSVKLARLNPSPTHRDSHVDAMAYLGIAFECAVADKAGG